MAYNRDRGNRSGGGNRNFGKPRFNKERTEMHSATCASCGKQCEVPFRPTGNKPVLCRDCFQSNRGSDSRRSFDRPSFSRDDNQSSPNYQAQFAELNTKVDKILSLLTAQPTIDIPLESEMSEETIDEIAQEVQGEEKPKKTKTRATKAATKTKKISSSKKK